MHYLIFDLDPKVKVTQNVALYPLHYVTYSATMFEVATSKDLGEDAFTRKIKYLTFDLDLVVKVTYKVKVTQNVAQCPLHHVTYIATKFEVATSNRLGGDTFTRKYII